MTARFRVSQCKGKYKSAQMRTIAVDRVTGDHARFITMQGAIEVVNALNAGHVDPSVLTWHAPSHCLGSEDSR